MVQDHTTIREKFWPCQTKQTPTLRLNSQRRRAQERPNSLIHDSQNLGTAQEPINKRVIG